MDLLKSHRMSCLVAQTHELGNLCGADRAEEAGCAFYFQEESRDSLQSYAHHLQVQRPRVPQKIILVAYLGIMGSRKPEKASALSAVLENSSIATNK